MKPITQNQPDVSRSKFQVSTNPEPGAQSPSDVSRSRFQAPANSEPETRSLKRSSISGFTLIELLVVIAIIGILAGLLLPALGGAREAAKKARAGVLVNSLGLALKAYYNEYGYWPSSSASPSGANELTVAQNLGLYQILTGSNIWASGNPRQIVFLDVKSADLGPVNSTSYLKDSLGTTNLVNPWGHALRVTVDYDGNPSMSAPVGAGTVSGGFAIWTVGGRNNTITNYNWK